MKYDISEIEVDSVYIDPDFIVSELNPVNEHTTFNPFPYANENKDLFKLVLNWQATIKIIDSDFIIADIKAEQEFKILFDGNNDKECLKNLISTSYLHLQDKFTEATNNSSLDGYRLLSFDDDKAAEGIMSSLDR